MGNWTSNSPKIHSHDYPTTYAASLGEPVVGGEWTCDCRDRFVVTFVTRVSGHDDIYYELDWKCL